MSALRISMEQARKVFLNAQALQGPVLGRGKSGALNAIEHLGYVQIDTISVVERAHHHVLWSRVDDYSNTHIDQLLMDASIFEYWSHAAAFLPMKDYRFSLRRKMAFRNDRSQLLTSAAVMSEVLQRIRSEGPLRSKDFEHKNTKSGWWEWKPAKMALERLFHEGILMVARRDKFQKVYDLCERVVDSSIDVSVPSHAEFARYLIKQKLRANAFVLAEEIAYLRGAGLKKVIQQELYHMCEDGVVVPLNIKNSDLSYFADPVSVAAHLQKRSTATTQILSPFDNAIIQRKRLQSLFQFDYVIECYVPKAKRVHGYFCLPILYGGALIARADCKADRPNRNFIIESLTFESMPDESCLSSLSKRFRDYATFNNCESIEMRNVEPKRIKKTLQRLLES